MENLEVEELEFLMVGNFLTKLKKEFSSTNDELTKVVNLKKVEQKSKIIEEFVQKFRKIVRDSGYGGRLLIEKFKRGMNSVIR